MNINKTLIASTLLHAGFFAAAVLFSAKVIKPLPLGVELAYDAVPSTPKSVPASSALKKVTSPVVIEKDDITTKAKEVVPVAVAPQAASSVGTVAQSGALSGREGVATGSEVSPEDRYLYELKKLLERRKNYPLMARKMGHTGTVTMRFTLKPDGTLAGSEVVGKAPYESLNQAAVTLVEGINGMKPFPQEIRKDSWSITVPIEYTLK
ncbi:energy transducer TonB [Bdellovibrio bacteriovorus]|nr:energy transducer TonB [Bdellovibrio bacteriovorus]